MAKRILVADDEVHIVKAVSLKLTNAGYDVVTVADGQEALEAAAEHVPDLVITDCQMPRVNGFELCQRLAASEATRSVPVMKDASSLRRNSVGPAHSTTSPQRSSIWYSPQTASHFS